MNEINLDNLKWEKLKGYATELYPDARWILKGIDDNKSYGSLRIVSHPDLTQLRPGYLRAIFTYVTSISPKDETEITKTKEDYQMKLEELEVYNIDNNIKTEENIYEAPYQELEKIFNVKVFD
jgi:hypothetical protein